MSGSHVVPGWLVRLCTPSRMLWLAPLFAFLLTLPSVLSGYVQDDHVYRQHTLDAPIQLKRPPWDYFNHLGSQAEIALYRERGVNQVTWWTPNTARARFFRPVASLLHALEFRFFGSAPWVMHIHRALLYALIAFLCVKLLTRFSTTPVACGIGCLLFAVDDVHAYSSGWISGANTLLTCVFGLFALLMHDRWRREQRTGHLALCLGAFLLSLLSSEGGLALMGYLVAYVLFLEAGSWKKRLATLAPAMVVAIGYGVFYVTQHLGVRGSFDYLSPTESLWQTALIVLSGTVTGTTSQVLSIPLLGMMLQLPGGALAAAAVLTAVALVLRRFLRSSKTVAFFGAGMVLSIVPFAVGMMGDRYLLWAGLGAAGLLGELFAVYKTAARLERITAKALLATHTIVSVLFFVPTLFWLAAIEGNIRKLEAMVTVEPTVMLNGHTIADNCAAAIRCEKKGSWPEHFYHLYEGFDVLTVQRTGDRTIFATTPKGWFASSMLSRGTRPKELIFEPGQTFDMQLMTATITEVTQDGRPLRVSFAFKKDLSEFAWLRLNMKGPQRIELPALGEEMRLDPWSN
ncbi:MAG: hypothetical protein HY898_04085 [Deltaproteobacteria bacterium]|nr:hypothetical protein [Deltaproteobacteria bacterium]